MPDGREVKTFTLTNCNGLKARVTEWGAILVSMEVPDLQGNLADLTLGFDDLAGWMKNPAYFGATVGRFGNRIAHGKFSLDGKNYSLATNNEPSGIPCHLHGGVRGFDQVLWCGQQTASGVEFSYFSPAGEEGYPGNLQIKVTYSLTDQNELIWQAEATTDAPTIINIVQHTYWNLSGDPSHSIENHEMQIFADAFLPTDAGMIPTGKLAGVTGTAMDFQNPRKIGEAINADELPLTIARGYDHCWVFPAREAMRQAARVTEASSGRVMEVFTNQPGVHFYTGNFLDGSAIGKYGIAYPFRSGFCLETENFPDAPNHSHFPSAVLRPGEIYQHKTIYQFSLL